MKLRSLIVAASLLSCTAEAASRAACGSIFALPVIQPTAIELAADVRVVELAKLHLELLALESATDRALMSAVFKKKFQRLQAEVGPELASAVGLVQKGLSKSAKKSKADEEKEREEREKRVKKESKDLGLLKTWIKTKFTNTQSLSDSYFDSRYRKSGTGNKGPELMTGHGVQWSKGDRYVAIRGEGEEGTVIYDMEAGKKLKYRPATGQFAQAESIYVEDDGVQMTVRDVATGEKWGPFPGVWYSRSISNENLIVTSVKTPRGGSSFLSDTHFTLVEFRTGRTIDLGLYFGYTRDFSRVVYKESEGTFAVLDTKTWTKIKTFKGTSGKLAYRDELFEFERDGTHMYFRIADLTEFPMPQEYMNGSRESRDFRFLAWEENVDLPKPKKKGSPKKRTDVVLQDTFAGTSTTYEGYEKPWFSPDGQWLILRATGFNSTGPSKLIDLRDMSATDVPAPLGGFSPTSRFLHGEELEKGMYRYHFYDRDSGNVSTVLGPNGLEFIPNTDFFLVRSEDKNITLLGDPENGATVPIGESEIGASSDGRYVITYQNGKAVIMKVK